LNREKERDKSLRRVSGPLLVPGDLGQKKKLFNTGPGKRPGYNRGRIDNRNGASPAGGGNGRCRVPIGGRCKDCVLKGKGVLCTALTKSCVERVHGAALGKRT